LPTLREDRGEIEAAQAGKLPKVVADSDIVADLHMHSTWSDGKMTILEMAVAAKEKGRQFIAITDHSVSLGIANGLSVERLLAQTAEIKEANEKLGPDFKVLHGTEMEIRADGNLDFPDEVLAGLDFVIASLHVSLSQPREEITQRLLGAIENVHVDMIAHPTGRLLPERAGADLDMDRIIEAAVRTGTILEINANPRRLDLRDNHVRMAVEAGAVFSINTDAHHTAHFDFCHYGVAVAQRGWATAEKIVNTWPLHKFLTYISETKKQ
jgi:DNA polymerase (family 10)